MSDQETARKIGEDALLEAFEYLDELRESGRTNMFGAPAYVEAELGWERNEALSATKLWMHTFKADVSAADRVKALLTEDAA